MTSRPRREWKSFSWLCRCSVRFLIRSLKMATWTSGEPVSLLPLAYSLMTSDFRSEVIDIGFSFRESEVHHAHRTELARFETGQSDEPAFGHGANHVAGGEPPNTVAVESVEKSNRLPGPKAYRLGGRQGQCRDVVQRGLDRQNVLKSGGTMAQSLQGVQ